MDQNINSIKLISKSIPSNKKNIIFFKHVRRIYQFIEAIQTKKQQKNETIILKS